MLVAQGVVALPAEYWRATHHLPPEVSMSPLHSLFIFNFFPKGIHTALAFSKTNNVLKFFDVSLHQGLYQKSTIINPQVVLGMQDFAVSLLREPSAGK